MTAEVALQILKDTVTHTKLHPTPALQAAFRLGAESLERLEGQRTDHPPREPFLLPSESVK